MLIEFQTLGGRYQMGQHMKHLRIGVVFVAVAITLVISASLSDAFAQYGGGFKGDCNARCAISAYKGTCLAKCEALKGQKK
jgi:hypothetical protein